MRRLPLLFLVLLSGCIPKAEAPRPAEEVRRPVKAAESDAATRQCLSDLDREAVEFKLLPDRVFDGGCSAIGAVQLRDIGTPVTNLGAMRCPLARAFARWTREAVQPAAATWMGSKVVRIESFGTYACRPINGQAGKKLSEHGRSNAVDISAFVFEDGRRLTVQEGWTGGGEDGRRFLRAVHQAGCRRFDVAMGPNANAYHYNHFHFDMGQGRYCR